MFYSLVSPLERNCGVHHDLSQLYPDSKYICVLPIGEHFRGGGRVQEFSHKKSGGQAIVAGLTVQ